MPEIIAVGGDGTMNEVVNGCFTQKYCRTLDIVLAMITVGTGNDWGRMYGIPNDYEEAIKIISAFNYRLQDTGMVKYFHGTRRERRYFLNIAASDSMPLWSGVPIDIRSRDEAES
jgi:diacylglycerol kinase family enzyme